MLKAELIVPLLLLPLYSYHHLFKPPNPPLLGNTYMEGQEVTKLVFLVPLWGRLTHPGPLAIFGFKFLLFMSGEKPFPFLDEMFFFGVTDTFHIGGESSGLMREHQNIVLRLLFGFISFLFWIDVLQMGTSLVFCWYNNDLNAVH